METEMTDMEEKKEVEPAENTANEETMNMLQEEKAGTVQQEQENTDINANAAESDGAEVFSAQKEEVDLKAEKNVSCDTEIPMDGTFVPHREKNPEPKFRKMGRFAENSEESAAVPIREAKEDAGQNSCREQDHAECTDNVMPSLPRISQDTWGSLLSLAVAFLGIFCLLNVNIAFVASNMASRSLLTFNFITIGAVSFLTALINTFLPGRKKVYVLWIASAVAFAAAVLIQF